MSCMRCDDKSTPLSKGKYKIARTPDGEFQLNLLNDKKLS